MPNDYENLQELRNDFEKLLETGKQFADARVVCYRPPTAGEDKVGRKKRAAFPVHKAVLVARSKFFAEAFADGKTKVEMLELSPNVISVVIYYLYTGIVPSLDELDEAELISLYNASTVYGLDIFLVGNISSKLVIKEFPKIADGKTSLPQMSTTYFGGKFASLQRNTNFASKEWYPKVRVGPRIQDKSLPKEALKAETEKEGVKKIHLDFELQWADSREQKVLVADLSLSILNSAGEKLKTVKREGFSSPQLKQANSIFAEQIISWRDCFEHTEIINEQSNLLQYSQYQKGQPQLIVLSEATVIVEKPPKKRFTYFLERTDVEYQKAFRILLETGCHSDARIVVCYDEKDNRKIAGEKKVVIPVHKCVLAARSKFFEAAFSIGMREAEKGEIEVSPELGLSPATVRAMLHFVYTASIPSSNIDQEGLIELFKAAHFYQIEGLMDKCIDLLHLTIVNCCDLLSLGHFYESKNLMKKVLKFILDRKEAVKATEGWSHLMRSDKDSNNEKLKTLCGHFFGETPITVENCCEVFQIGEDYENGEISTKAYVFAKANREKMQDRLMESEDGKRLKAQLDLVDFFIDEFDDEE